MRTLDLKLRPMDTWRVKGTLEDLFAGKDKVVKDIYVNSLVIQSADHAAMSIEK